jgi:hypothetical protein
MKRFLVTALAGLFLFSLPGLGLAQKEVQPPPVPPMLEGQRPLQSPEAKEPAPPKKAEAEKAKPKAKSKPGAKAAPKAQKKADQLKKSGKKKLDAAKGEKKKTPKGTKKKRPAPEPGPDEG